MTGRRFRFVAILVVAVAATIAVGGPAVATPSDPVVGPSDPVAGSAVPVAAPSDAVAGSSSTAGAATSAQASEFVERFEYRLLPGESDWVEADVSYQLPSGTDQLSVFEEGSRVQVVRGDGFAEHDGGEWRWDGSTESPSLTVRVRVETDYSRSEWIGYGTSEWAIVERPPSLSIASDATTTGRTLEYAVDGEGVAGTDAVFLGEHETYETNDDNERVVLVVPDSVRLPDAPEDVAALLEHASDRIRVGHRPASVYHGFVVPEIGTDLLGVNHGTDSLYFNRFRLDTADGVWVHEYVHSRQDTGAVTRETRWLVEGSADYYEPLLVLEQGHVDFEAFRQELQRGEQATYDDVVLSDPGTWHSNAAYTHGATVTAAIDREIREQSGGDATFQGVLAAWNEDDGSFTQADFLDAVEAAGGTEARDLARQLTETSTLPQVWDRQTHERLFEGASATDPGGDGPGDADQPAGSAGLETTATGDTPFTVDGPYREGAVIGPLAVGERVAVELAVTNDGDEAGTVERALTVGDRTADRASVTVEPGGRETIELVATLEQEGEHRLSAAGTSTTVSVRERVEPGIESVHEAVEGGSAGVEVVVAAGDRGLTVGDYEVAAGDRTLEAGTIVLSAGHTRTLRTTVAGDAETVTVTVGGETRTVEIAGGDGTGGDGTDDGLPGFGAVPALLALLAAGGLLAARAGRTGTARAPGRER